MNRSDALVVTLDVIALLDTACERIVMVGDMRRRYEDVKTIEIAAVPRFDEVADGLWGNRAPRNMLEARIGHLVHMGALQRVSGGPRHVNLIHPESGVWIYLVIVLPPAQFGVVLATYNSPPDFLSLLARRAWHRGFHFDGGALRYGANEPHLDCQHGVVPTPDEATLFDRLGIEAPPASLR